MENITAEFETSMEEVIEAARNAAAETAWDIVPESRITTAMAAVAWDTVPNERITTAIAAIAW